MRVIKEKMLLMVPSVRVYLDVDDLREGSGATELPLCGSMLCYLSEGYFDSISCMRELLWAVHLRKPVVVLVELNPMFGGLSIDEARWRLENAYSRFSEWGILEELAEWVTNQSSSVDRPDVSLPDLTQISDALFRGATVLEWTAIHAYQDEVVRTIAEMHVVMLDKAASHNAADVARAVTNSVRRTASRGRSAASNRMNLRRSLRDSIPASERQVGTFLQNAPQAKSCCLSVPQAGQSFHMYASQHNAGAQTLIAELQEGMQLRTLRVTYELHEMGECEQMLVYLRTDTWKSSGGHAFGKEVWTALRLGMPLLLVHEDVGLDAPLRHGSRFEAVIASTPSYLVRGGIYSTISVPLRGGILRETAMAILAEVLAATKIKRIALGGEGPINKRVARDESVWNLSSMKGMPGPFTDSQSVRALNSTRASAGSVSRDSSTLAAQYALNAIAAMSERVMDSKQTTGTDAHRFQKRCAPAPACSSVPSVAVSATSTISASDDGLPGSSSEVVPTQGAAARSVPQAVAYEWLRKHEQRRDQQNAVCTSVPSMQAVHTSDAAGQHLRAAGHEAEGEQMPLTVQPRIVMPSETYTSAALRVPVILIDDEESVEESQLHI